MSEFQAVQDGIQALQSKLSAELKSGLSAQDAKIERAITELAQGGTSIKAMPGTDSRSVGAQVAAKFAENADLFSKTKSVRLEVKAAADVVTSTSGRSIVTGGVGAPTGLPYGVQNGLRITPAAGVSAVEYFRYGGVEGAGSVQAGEGALKSAVRPTHTAITQSALTVAAWTKISRQSLGDSAELKQAIEITLVREVGKALDAALMDGSVTPAFAGLEALATSYTSLVYSNLWDAASEAVATMAIAGFVADTVVLSPADWLQVQTATNATTGDYFSGSYLAPLAESLRGLRAVVSPSMPTGKVMVLDSQQIELKLVDTFAVEANVVDDDFIRNQVTLLGELRVIPIYRAVGAGRLVTPKA